MNSRTEFYWIEGPWPGRLAISSRPRGGDWLEDEVRAWQQAGIEMIVSLLTKDEIADLDLNQEAEFCRNYGLQFIAFPIEDRSVPYFMAAIIGFCEEVERRFD